ncbi:hypothetical protein E2C01_090075 [Portunus trituberculatus]|uniref:Uncharacterized protein n=1 Tax=Portunus trituberculatus TaxID=210409 RepID=A0A5B7JJY3_PORTR|nr:hypothetical protein [Portunus trituberculatus]
MCASTSERRFNASESPLCDPTASK